MDCFIHQSPGRIRVRAGNPKFELDTAQRLTQALEDMDGVELVTIRRVTGSVVVHYDSGVVLPSAILRVLGRWGVVPSNLVGFPRPVPPRRPGQDRLPAVADGGSLQLSPETQKILWAAGKVLLAIFIERAVDKKARTFLSALL